MPLSELSDCKFPNLSGSSGYNYGCRCDRCKSAKYATQRRRVTYIKAPEQRSCLLCNDSYIVRTLMQSRYIHLCPRCHNIHQRRLAMWRKHHVSNEIIVTWLKDPTCWICSQAIDLHLNLRTEARGQTWVVDHDHTCCDGGYSCGQCIRGLAHHNCNILLGYLEPFLATNGLARLEWLGRYLQEQATRSLISLEELA